MFIVPITDYPESKEWNDKIFSTPSIPGGKNLLLKNLRALLLAVRDNAPLDEIPQLKDSNSNCTLNALCVHQLSAIHLVERTSNGGWALSKEATLWIDSEDDLYLAAYFSANVRFFAEILFYLDTPKTSRELFNIAVNEYDMAWKIVTTINNRLIWLRQFGLIEFQEFSLLYSITDKGKEFLKTVKPVMPESIIFKEDATENEKDIVIDDLFITFFTENKNTIRKAGFGFFPGKADDFANNLTSFIESIEKCGLIEDINEYALSKYNIKYSSTRSALNTISNMGLVIRSTNTTYAVTDLGYRWLESQNNLCLIPLFQLRYLFFLEILQELKDSSLSTKELATFAKVSYGFDKENQHEINNRISILKSAQLIMNVSAEKLALTNRGALLIEKYGDIFGINKPKITNVNAEVIDNADIASELRLASKDSFNPDRFERTVKDCFALFGFEAEWLGGAGKTDVLLKTPGSPIDSFVVTVDAKTTTSSVVTDGLVDFDTLNEHKKKHGSDYIAIVGRDFNDRLIRRAEEHHVVLFDVDTLISFLNLHQKTPLKLSAYKKVFEQSGKADLSVLDSEINNLENFGSLLRDVLELLISECEDPITKGQLSVRDLYMSLRNNRNSSHIPTIGEIETAISFLSSPLIGCVTKEKDYYCATGSLNDLKNKLDYLKGKC